MAKSFGNAAGELGRGRRLLGAACVSALVLFMGIASHAQVDPREASLRASLQVYVEASRAGEVDRAYDMYDAISWKVIPRRKWTRWNRMEREVLREITDWKLESVRIIGNAAQTKHRLYFKEFGPRPDPEALLWKWDGTRWWVTLDDWGARNPDPALWEDYDACIGLNASGKEPAGDYRSEVAALSKSVAEAMSEHDCDSLVKLMNPVTCLWGVTSWDIEESLRIQCGFGALDGTALAENIVQWRPNSIELVNPVTTARRGNRRHLKAKLSCWEIFVPFKEPSPYMPMPQGLRLLWIRTPQGVRLVELYGVNLLVI